MDSMFDEACRGSVRKENLFRWAICEAGDSDQSASEKRHFPGCAVKDYAIRYPQNSHKIDAHRPAR